MIANEKRIGVDVSMDQLSMMAKQVLRAIDNSLKSLQEKNILLAYNVIDEDKAINSYEIDIDNSTFSLLSLNHIPSDILRRIITIQKLNAILERIGDHAVNIAESAISLSNKKDIDLLNLPEMGNICRENLENSLKSFFTNDIDLAKQVKVSDDIIDDMNKELTKNVKQKVFSGEIDFETALDLIRVSKNLERVADLSANIAEEAIFAAIGRTIKHEENEFL